MSSERAGSGKSLAVCRLSQRLSKLQNNETVMDYLRDMNTDMPLCINVPIYGPIIHQSAVVESLLHHTVAPDLPVSRIFHVDVHPSVNFFFFHSFFFPICIVQRCWLLLVLIGEYFLRSELVWIHFCLICLSLVPWRVVLVRSGGVDLPTSMLLKLLQAYLEGKTKLLRNDLKLQRSIKFWIWKTKKEDFQAECFYLSQQVVSSKKVTAEPFYRLLPTIHCGTPMQTLFKLRTNPTG